MYNVKVAGSAQSVTSYDAAKAGAKAALATTAENIRTNRRLFRSPKVGARIAAEVLRTSFPKKSGDIRRVVAGVVPVTILKA